MQEKKKRDWKKKTYNSAIKNTKKDTRSIDKYWIMYKIKIVLKSDVLRKRYQSFKIGDLELVDVFKFLNVVLLN